MRDLVEQPTESTTRSRVIQDPLRPGPTRVRLVPEEIPVWALIGLGKTLVEKRNAAIGDEIVVREIAHEYGISVDAARVAVDWYERYPHAIDAWLADNAAGFDRMASAGDR